MSVNNNFFVYALLDPRTSCCDYSFGTLTHKIFYIGKGCGKRPYDHIRDSNKKNSPKNQKINSIIKQGCFPIVHLIKENLDENAAYELEKNVIKEIGLDNLTNQCSGGIGRCRESMIGQKNPMYGKSRPLVVAKMQKARAKTNRTDKLGKSLEERLGQQKASAAKAKMSTIRKGKTWEEYFGEEKAAEIRKQRKASRGTRHHSEETKKKMRATGVKPEVVRAKVEGILRARKAKFDKIAAELEPEIENLITKGFTKQEIYRRLKTRVSRFLFKKIAKPLLP